MADRRASQLHYTATQGGVLLTGDTNGDSVADSTIFVVSNTAFQPSNFPFHA